VPYTRIRHAAGMGAVPHDDNSTKFAYYCVEGTNCGPIWETFAKDAFLGLALLFGYIALTVGMLWNHKRGCSASWARSRFQ